MARFSWMILLLWFTLPVSANPSIEMELTAGLSGQAVIGQATEIKIRIYSTATAEAELQLEDANGLISVPLVIDELAEKNLWINVTPKKMSPIQVRLVTSTGQKITKQLYFENNRDPLTLITSSVPSDTSHQKHQQPENIRPVIVSASNLPHRSQSYASILAIVTDAKSLSSLSLDQYQAFANYLSGCNILLLSEPTSTVLNKIKNISGCAGQFVQGYNILSEISPLLQKLKSQRTPKLPSPQNLKPFQQPEFQHNKSLSITLYLAAYILFTALVINYVKKTHYLLLLPVIAASAAVFVWTGTGSSKLISWAETESDSNHLRVSSLLQIGGNRLGENKLTIVGDNSIFNFRTETQHPRIRYITDTSQSELTTHTSFLTPQIYHLTTVSKQTLPYTLTMKQGKPQLKSLQKRGSDTARLLWMGHNHKVPFLSQGETWQPDESNKQLASSPEEKLLHRRLQFETPALLLPYSIDPSPVANNIDTTGWLVIRPKTELNL